MTKQHIQSTLTALKAESEKINSSDSDAVESINQLINKLEHQLSEPDIADPRNLIDQLQLSINKFEISHPTVTSIVNDLMVKLAGLGV